MVYALVILGFLSVILLFLLLLQRSELRSISRQLKEIKRQDTNELVHSIGSDKTSAQLINEINALLGEIQHSRVWYQQKNHALEQMMTNISHDLRTPLTSAMGYIHMIQNSDITEEEKERELAIIENRLSRLEELINSFFEFSQIISNEKTPEKTEVNLVAVLEESIAHYYDDYCGQGREILLHCEPHKLMIHSNKNMLLRIFDNLINNAFKHGAGDLTVSILTDSTELSECVQIRFENTMNPLGMQNDPLQNSDMDINHIFDEFYTTDISRTKGNTGLGLAIVKQFTEMLHGSVSAENVGGFFVITVIFPERIQSLPHAR